MLKSLRIAGVAAALVLAAPISFAQTVAGPAVVATTTDNVPVAEAPSGKPAATVNDVSESTGSVLVDQIVNWLKALTSAMIPIAIGAITYWFKQKTGVQVDDGLRQGFQTAAENAAGWLVQQLGAKAAQMTGLAGRLAAGDANVRKAVEMAKAGSSDAQKHFSISDSAYADKIEAKLGILTGPTDAAGAPVVKA